MAKLVSIFFFCILCSVGFASIKYEHISSWDRNYYERCISCRTITFTCGVNNSDDAAINQNWTSEYYEHISFVNCKFTDILSSIIAMFNSIRSLNITDVELYTLQPKVLSNLTKLEKLMASNNRLTELPPKLFVNTTQIANVDFSKNAIKRIDPLTFENVTSLQTLNLSNNQLDRIEPICLDHPKLRELDLSNNHLSFVEKNVFDKLANLLKLNLSNNNLSPLEDGLFDKMTALTHLDLASNRIGNLHVGIFSQLANLEYLSLRGTNISSIELGTFSYQHKLISLDLSDNQITEFDFDLFFPIVHDLRSLYLSQNRLQHLNGFRNAIFPSLVLLDIQNNSFNCSYLKYFFGLVNWDKIRLAVDPSSTQPRKSNIRGINCEASSTSEAYINEYSTVQKTEMQNSLNDNLIRLIVKSSDEAFGVKVILFLVLTVIATCGAMYLLVNRNRLFNSNRYHRGVGEQDASSDPMVKYSSDGVLLME
ncbi:leucine-rich repeat-containing protein 15-like [Bradysia coprophila]|uniref:leucine-rich repeat-containing protein 15-like n=1 Tax=Bradysia coprophila TaxID=38358 RepID=UPI00187DB15C|nr:leucine-rich repeat-containing protein 15-like [Bradysia coprophila]